jgi:hypothetical protein
MIFLSNTSAFRLLETYRFSARPSSTRQSHDSLPIIVTTHRHECYSYRETERKRERTKNDAPDEENFFKDVRSIWRHEQIKLKIRIEIE